MNCSAYSESVTSHALAWLAGSRLVLMQQRVAGGRHGRHLEITTSSLIKNPNQSMHIYWKNNPAKFYPNPIWNPAVLGFLEGRCPNKKQHKKNNNKMSSNMGLVPVEKLCQYRPMPVLYTVGLLSRYHPFCISRLLFSLIISYVLQDHWAGERNTEWSYAMFGMSVTGGRTSPQQRAKERAIWCI